MDQRGVAARNGEVSGRECGAGKEYGSGRGGKGGRESRGERRTVIVATSSNVDPSGVSTFSMYSVIEVLSSKFVFGPPDCTRIMIVSRRMYVMCCAQPNRRPRRSVRRLRMDISYFRLIRKPRSEKNALRSALPRITACMWHAAACSRSFWVPL